MAHRPVPFAFPLPGRARHGLGPGGTIRPGYAGRQRTRAPRGSAPPWEWSDAADRGSPSRRVPLSLAPAIRVHSRQQLHFPRFPQPDGTRIRTVADPVVEGRSLVVEAIRALAIACRARRPIHPIIQT